MSVIIEYGASFGFEIVTNLLRDDGNEVRDVRIALMNEEMENVYIVLTEHHTGNMICYIVMAST